LYNGAADATKHVILHPQGCHTWVRMQCISRFIFAAAQSHSCHVTHHSVSLHAKDNHKYVRQHSIQELVDGSRTGSKDLVIKLEYVHAPAQQASILDNALSPLACAIQFILFGIICAAWEPNYIQCSKGCGLQGILSWKEHFEVITLREHCQSICYLSSHVAWLSKHLIVLFGAYSALSLPNIQTTIQWAITLTETIL
jgi:hypothetical protein